MDTTGYEVVYYLCIATSLQADLDREQAFRVHGSVRELLERQQPSNGA